MSITGTEAETAHQAPPPIAFRPGDPILVPTIQDILSADPDQFTAKFTDIAANNLACAVGLPRTDELDIPKFLALVDAMAAMVQKLTEKSWRIFDLKPGEFNHSKNVYCVLTMNQVLFKHFGIQYNPERKTPDGKTDFSRLDEGDTGDAFIHGMLGPRKIGLCGTFPVLAVGVGRRLGYPLYLAKRPDHLLCRWHDQQEYFNIECTGTASSIYTDKFYEDWPSKLDQEMWRKQDPIGSRWLDSMPARVEMARFISNRIITLRHYNRHGEALDWLDALEKFHRLPYDQWRLESRGKVGATRQVTLSSDPPSPLSPSVTMPTGMVSPFATIPALVSFTRPEPLTISPLGPRLAARQAPHPFAQPGPAHLRPANPRLPHPLPVPRPSPPNSAMPLRKLPARPLPPAPPARTVITRRPRPVQTPTSNPQTKKEHL